MRSRYSPLDGDATVFRTVKPGGAFLPPGHQLPIPEWLEPNRTDIEEAAKSGRPPGLSVWDKALTSFEHACRWRQVDPDDELAFSAQVHAVRSVAVQHDRELDVVADPLDLATGDRDKIVEAVPVTVRAGFAQSAQGHSLIEGIKRPSGCAKKEHRSFRDELTRVFSPL